MNLEYLIYKPYEKLCIIKNKSLGELNNLRDI